MLAPLSRNFYDRETEVVARDLLGCLLVRRTEGRLFVARVVETEAYVGPHDQACHAAKGLTPRTEVLHGPPGHAYVYFVYGLHHLFNVVTEREGHGSGVLFRALEPIDGFPEGAKTDGPAKLSRILGIDKEMNRWDLTLGEKLWLAPGDREAGAIARGPRIGVDYAGEWASAPLRFWIEGNPWVSCQPRAGRSAVLQSRSTRRSRKG